VAGLPLVAAKKMDRMGGCQSLMGQEMGLERPAGWPAAASLLRAMSEAL
jgi:hypothetical protein